MGMLAGRYQKPNEYPAGSRGARGHWFYNERITPAGLEAAGEIGAVAKEAGLKPAELALAWAKDQPGITAAIIGPRIEDHLETALKVLALELPPEVNEKLDEIVPPGSAVSNFFNNSGWMQR